MLALAERTTATIHLAPGTLAVAAVVSAMQGGLKTAKVLVSLMKFMQHGKAMAIAMMAHTFQPIMVAVNVQQALQFG